MIVYYRFKAGPYRRQHFGNIIHYIKYDTIRGVCKYHLGGIKE